MSIIWPSDSVSQCDVDTRWSLNENHATKVQSGPFFNEANGAEEEELFEGDDLANAMSALDLSTTLPPPRTPRARRRTDTEQPTTPAPVLYELRYPVLAPPDYQPLNTIRGSSWERFGTPTGTAPLPTPPFTGKGTLLGDSGKSAKYHNTQREGDMGLASNLVNAIYKDITRRRGGKRFARLGMDDSGRWRVVRNSRPTKTFPPE